MIDIAVIRQKLRSKCTAPLAEKNSDENAYIDSHQPGWREESRLPQPDVETGPSLTEQIKLAQTWQGATALAIVANLEKLKMLAEVSEEIKGMK